VAACERGRHQYAPAEFPGTGIQTHRTESTPKAGRRVADANRPDTRCSARPGQSASVRARGPCSRGINHKLLIDFLRQPPEPIGTEPDVVGMRGVYAEIEGLLTHDHRF
jgi:hypothetical protein